MAIILEEEKKPINWVSIVGIGVVVLVVFFGSYYLFFKKPQLIDVVAPIDLSNINALAQVQVFDPQAIVNSSNFKALKDFTTPLVLPPTGRSNPFRP
ncbi:MAG: hypothetical protein AAB601_00165 [Patescibacteria group bacterium]